MTVDIDGFFCVVIIVSIDVVLLLSYLFLTSLRNLRYLSEISKEISQSFTRTPIAKSSLLVVGLNLNFKIFLQ